MSTYRFNRIVILLTILTILTFIFSCQPSGEVFQSYGKERIELDGVAKEYLLSLARNGLEGKAGPSDAPPAVSQAYSKDVFVTVFLPGTRHQTGKANGGSISASVKQAVEKIKTDRYFQDNFSENLDKTRIVINVIDQVKMVKQSQTKKLDTKQEKRFAKKLKRAIEPGIHGMILVTDGQAFFQIPQEVYWQCWSMEGENRILGTKLFYKRIEQLCKKERLASDIWHTAKIFRFSTIAFVEDKPGGGGNALSLYRGNVLIDKKITRSQLLESAARGGRNLGVNQDTKGKYGYIYYPCEDKFDPSYNIVRHAGTTYSLFQIYRATGDPYYKEAALKALKYLEPFIETPEDKPDIALLKFKNRSDLGSNALLTLALIEMPDELLEANPQYRDLLKKLGQTLLLYQMEDGSFYKRYKEIVKQRPPKKQPIYYPGETFLAFVRLYEKTKDQRFLDAATKAADYQIDDFKKSGKPCNWAIQAYSRYYRQDPKDQYAKACYDMADELLSHQWGTFKEKKMPYKDFYGGADNGWPPRSTPTASRTEAITEAHDLAAFRKDQSKVSRYAEAVMAALWFDMCQQYRPETTYWMPNPNRALGGMKGSPIANDIRIDYTQHFMTGAIHGLHIAEKIYGKGTLNSDLGIIDVASEGISLAEAEKRVLANQGKDFAAPDDGGTKSVYLTKGNINKVELVKEVRSITGLGLKDAVDLIESAPKPLKTDISAMEAKKIKSRIEKAGGGASIQ